jgi:predicted DNA-binding protein (MmcQ/YjbR family)
MFLEEIREYCLQKKGVEECMPFGNDTLVFKVAGKIFLLSGIDNQPVKFNVKCDPTKAIEWREKYPCVLPGYHMNKQHWNTIICDGSVYDNQIKEWIDDSYNIVVSSLTKKLKQELEKL